MSANSVGTKSLDIGTVFSDTFAVIGRNLQVLAMADLLLLGIPVAIEIAGALLTRVSPLFAFVTLVGTLAYLVGLILTYGAVMHAAMQDLHNQPVSFDRMLKVALRKFWPMIGLAILISLGVALGFVLLIVPGVILGLAWSAALPALVVEDRRVMESFKRSAELTRGRRWSIFLLYLVVGIVSIVVEVVLMALFGGFQSFTARTPTTFNTIVAPLLSLVSVPFGGVMSIALFNQLRGKEGYGSEAVAEVFA